MPNSIPMIGYCKICLINGRSRTFICETSAGQLIGACLHEVTNGRLMRHRFGCYLIIKKAKYKSWPSGTSVKGKVIESRIMKLKNVNLWVEHYINVFQTNVLTETGQVYTELSKYDRHKGCYMQYLTLEIEE